MKVTDRCKFYFGTREWMQWFPTPLSGAESTPEDWNSSGSLLNGGGFSFHSWQSHKVYQYSWRNTSAREVAQMMKSYRDGSFGRGLIYFIDPLIYDTNVLPASLAAPAATEGTSAGLIENAIDTVVPVGDPGVNELPVLGLRVFHPHDVAVFKPRRVFIPIPSGFKLHLGGFYEDGGIRPTYTIVGLNGNEDTTVRTVPSLDPNGSEVVTRTGITGRGIYLSFSKDSGRDKYMVLRALIGRLVPTVNHSTSIFAGPWIGGQGHSGCRFDGPPTYIEYNGIDGGQVGFSATFKEVGLWLPYGLDGGLTP